MMGQNFLVVMFGPASRRASLGFNVQSIPRVLYLNLARSFMAYQAPLANTILGASLTESVICLTCGRAPLKSLGDKGLHDQKLNGQR